ncbi:MAG: response regulator transcription factor [Deferribacteres bacterium]|nr:response regulator transcription factor [candidate division KSB1 bacterium]MCB9500486.1 response regulator transcription factor [Deferribacteres bacterium]
MYKILIVEDEESMRRGLRDNLVFEGYEVDMAAEGEAGLKKILENQYHLVLLDVMMPRMSGFDVCQKARKNGIQTPIILLTAKGEEIDKVLGLELGADDYITKPFSLRELLARVKAALRRQNEFVATTGELIQFGDLEVDLSKFIARRAGYEVQLTHREFEIIRHLWEHKNEVVSREELLNAVWGYDAFPTTRTIDNFMLKLRQKAEADPQHPRHILTVHGIGYKFIP